MLGIMKLKILLIFILFVIFSCASSHLGVRSPAQHEKDLENRISKEQYPNRSRQSIEAVVQNNINKMKTIYNQRLKDKPELKGKIYTQISIDELGKVISCEILTTTMNDSTFENNIIKEILTWKFGIIPIAGKIDKIIYPFVFRNKSIKCLTMR